MDRNRPVPAKRASSVPYFYGRITREEAEKILTIHGRQEGSYLLRESINPLGNYSISICHCKSIHHYIIQKQPDGQYMIPEGKKFPGPVELIEHHSINLDGFVTQPALPCLRGQNQQAVAFRGMTYDDLEKEMVTRARTIKDVNLERALGPMRDHLIKMVARDLHLKQPWYHGKVGRTEAENRLRKEGIKQGQFLIRQRDDKKSYALTISFRGNEVKHYIIGVNNDDKYSIEDGPKFECLIMLIDHYHNKQDGLSCKLEFPCPNPSSSPADVRKYMRTCNEHLFDCALDRSPSVASNSVQDRDNPPGHRAPLRPLNRNSSHRENIPLPPIPSPGAAPIDKTDMAEPPELESEAPEVNVNGDELENEYLEVRRKEKRFELEPNRLTLQEKLGSGQFGFVFKGLCQLGGKEIPVAIKKLKKEELVPGVEPELYREAKVMQELENKHIVQMIGICKSDGIMLVLEIAPLGPLNKFLPKNKELKEVDINRLMLQVARGMAYLESKKFVHRDLAARNVLLVTKRHAKISDFGMSKALSRDNNYYEAQQAGKWPLKWYAMECILYWKFDSKSDVWSYGVTMWEAFTYGEKPYAGMKSQEILQFLQNGNRLAKPQRCSDGVYKIMKKCWKENNRERPTFAELASEMEILHQNLLISM